MRLKSGKYAQQTTEVLILKRPDWAQWIVEEFPDSPLSDSLRELESKLDRRKFIKKCTTCGRPATQASAYSNTSSLMFWCDGCDPYGSGARGGTLTKVRTFEEALRHVDMTCDGRRSEKRTIIKELARAKGLSKRVDEKHALEFFDI